MPTNSITKNLYKQLKWNLKKHTREKPQLHTLKYIWNDTKWHLSFNNSVKSFLP